MAITSNDILQNILLSINTALQDTSLSEDNRGALIDQYERTSIMIRDGYQFSDVDLLDLPTTIRNETIILLNEVIATFENTSQTLQDNFQIELTKLTNYNVTTEDANSILTTVTNKSQEIDSSLNTFNTYLSLLAQIKDEIQANRDDAVSSSNLIQSYSIPTEATYNFIAIDDSLANIVNNILKIKEDVLKIKIGVLA